MRMQDIEVGKEYAYRRGPSQWHSEYRVRVEKKGVQLPKKRVWDNNPPKGLEVTFLGDDGEPRERHRLVATRTILMPWAEFAKAEAGRKAIREREDAARRVRRTESLRKAAKLARVGIVTVVDSRGRIQLEDEDTVVELLLEHERTGALPSAETVELPRAQVPAVLVTEVEGHGNEACAELELMHRLLRIGKRAAARSVLRRSEELAVAHLSPAGVDLILDADERERRKRLGTGS